MNEVIHKQAELSYTDEGVIKATLSRFGNVDTQGDIMLAGCFDEWLAENGDKPLHMLKAHDPKAWPLGFWTDFTADSDGLHAVGKLALEENFEAQTAAKMIKSGMVDGVSVGFRMLAGKMVPRDMGVMGRDIRKAHLMEASITPYKPANEEAVISEIDGEETKNIYKMEGMEDLVREAMERWKLQRAAVESFIKGWGVRR